MQNKLTSSYHLHKKCKERVKQKILGQLMASQSQASSTFQIIFEMDFVGSVHNK